MLFGIAKRLFRAKKSDIENQNDYSTIKMHTDKPVILKHCDPIRHLGQSWSPTVSISSGLWTLPGSRRYWHQFLMQFSTHAVVKGFGYDLV